MDPDGDPILPGVQVTGPMLIIVDDVGPEPAGGYLNAAIRGANELPYADTIEVRHGDYDASEPITDPVTIVSEEGSASNTVLTGNLSFLSTGIRLGRLRRGFTITGNITVGAGVDAFTIHTNWNDILGMVINEGDGVLDATYNWWGGRHPILDGATEGRVNVNPYLPRPSDEVIEFMDDHDLTPDEALLVLWLLDQGVPERQAFTVLELVRALRPDPPRGPGAGAGVRAGQGAACLAPNPRLPGVLEVAARLLCGTGRRGGGVPRPDGGRRCRRLPRARHSGGL